MGMSERETAWQAIEQTRLGPCYWSQVSENRRMVIEAMQVKGSSEIVIVQKFYEQPLPRPGRGKAWPALASVDVYRPMKEATFKELDRALAAIGDCNNS